MVTAVEVGVSVPLDVAVMPEEDIFVELAVAFFGMAVLFPGIAVLLPMPAAEAPEVNDIELVEFTVVGDDDDVAE